ncbi:MAG: hypothetical protein ACFCGT_27070 [Sandaracinaceae bacterium]
MSCLAYVVCAFVPVLGLASCIREGVCLNHALDVEVVDPFGEPATPSTMRYRVNGGEWRAVCGLASPFVPACRPSPRGLADGRVGDYEVEASGDFGTARVSVTVEAGPGGCAETERATLILPGPGPETPRIPWLEAGVPPIDWPCPDGWRQVSEGGVPTCDPYPEGGARACPDGEAHFPGEAECTPIGLACPEGPFADTDDLALDTPRIFVLASAEAGGIGSESSPFRTLAAALDQATSGAVILLGRGRYEVDRAWPDGVSVRGRCAREASLTVAEDSERPAVMDIARHGSPVRVESLSVGPAPVVGIQVRRPGGLVTLDGIRVEGVTGDPAAISVISAAHVAARSLVVRNTLPRPHSEDAVGVSIDSRARLDLRRALLERNLAVGLAASGEGTEADLEDVVVRDTAPQQSRGTFGRGLDVSFGARVMLRRALVERNGELGVVVANDGTEAVLEDLVVRDTAPERNGAFGRGVGVAAGASLALRRALLERNHDVGIFASNPGSVAVLDDVVVRDTLPRQTDRRSGNGLAVQLGARVELRRGVLERSRECGVLVRGDDVEARFVDLVVRDTLPRERDGAFGRGMSVEGATIELRRTLVERNRGTGVYSGGDGTVAVFEDVVVRDTLAQESDGSGGRGLNVELGARVVLRRGLFERNREVGVYSSSEGTHAVLEDVVVRETLAPACLPDCDDLPSGVSLGSYFNADVQVSRFELAGGAVCGVQVASDGLLRLSSGIVRDHPIAICLQDPDYPVELLRQDVHYVDNPVILDTTGFALPDPVEAVGPVRP